MIKGAIFDVDGTLLDSMEIWEDVGVRYLNSIGIEAEPDLGTVLFTMSIQEGAAYVKEHYHLSQEPEEIVQGVLDIISNYYKKTALLKSGAKELLEKLDKHNIPMTVASSNNKKEIEMAFERLGIAKYFDRIFTCEEVGAGKTKPDIYLRAAEYLGTRPEETVVFEDVIHAIRTAKQAGFQVVGIYDETSKDDQEEVRREADWYCREWAELMKKKTALTIAGSDSSGGAGIQADIKTMQANGVYAMSAITALTAQNTTGVTGIMEVSPEFLEQQLDAVITDIRPDAVKIGMVSSEELIKMISKKLKEYHLENIVVDPVMVATSGSRLLEEDAVDTLKKELLPIATVITPNIPEAEILCGMEIHTEEDMVAAAKAIYEDLGCAVLLKGGHNINDANDLLYTKEEVSWFKGKRINNPNTHGTGCTLSSAIAANLAKGFDLKISVQRAKDYISRALADMLDLGAGSGPMNHAFDLKDEWKEEA
jgi:hydroxymethylpyrimidine kinase/phosphomethylpyrimidine kinase